MRKGTPENGDERMQRTTVTIPASLHKELMALAAEHAVTADEIMREGIRREVLRRKPDPAVPIDPNPELHEELALRFFASLPTPFVIKETARARILWCNPQYSEDFHVSLLEARGRTLQELGLVTERDQAIKAIQGVIENGAPRVSGEYVILRDEARRIPLHVVRWLFKDPSRGRDDVFLGDVSFDATRMTARHHPSGDLFRRVAKAECRGVKHLLAPALQDCPCAIALKDSDRRPIWCNTWYAKLAGEESPAALLSNPRRIEEIWDLSSSDPAVLSEVGVVEDNVWMYCRETLPDLHAPGRTKIRASLRFPIPHTSSTPPLVGVISLHQALLDIPEKSADEFGTATAQPEPSRSE